MISLAVMAHPSRRDFVDQLLPLLDREAEVVWDQRNDRWDTGRRSLLAFDSAATHHLVIQDDAIPCRDLVAGAEKMVEHSEDHPVGLYMGRQDPKLKALAGQIEEAGWIAHEGPWWGPGLVIPTEHIPELVAWGDEHPEIPNYDRRITRWYRQAGIACWYSCPSLVDHRPDHVSLVPGRNSTGRVAARFIGREASALECDWSAEPLHVPPPAATQFRHIRTGRLKGANPDTELHRRLLASPDVWQPIPEPR